MIIIQQITIVKNLIQVLIYHIYPHFMNNKLNKFMLNRTEMTYKSDKSRQIPINGGNLIIQNIKMHNNEVRMHVIE